MKYFLIIFFVLPAALISMALTSAIWGWRSGKRWASAEFENICQ